MLDSPVIEIEDVFVAKIVSSEVIVLSLLKIFFLISRSSLTASITKSDELTLSISVVKIILS